MEKLDITNTNFTQQASKSQDCKRVAESIHRASEFEKKKCALQTKYKLQVVQKKKSEGKTYQSAFFARLTVDSDEWDSDDDIPLASVSKSYNYDSEDNIPLAPSIINW